MKKPGVAMGPKEVEAALCAGAVRIESARQGPCAGLAVTAARGGESQPRLRLQKPEDEEHGLWVIKPHPAKTGAYTLEGADSKGAKGLWDAYAAGDDDLVVRVTNAKEPEAYGGWGLFTIEPSTQDGGERGVYTIASLREVEGEADNRATEACQPCPYFAYKVLNNTDTFHITYETIQTLCI